MSQMRRKNGVSKYVRGFSEYVRDRFIYRRSSDLVLDFFDGNKCNAGAWWNTPNLLLGGLTPIEMIVAGRKNKLDRFIRNALAENKQRSNIVIKKSSIAVLDRRPRVALAMKKEIKRIRNAVADLNTRDGGESFKG